MAAAVAGVVWAAVQLGEREGPPSSWVMCPRELTYVWAWRDADRLRHYRWLPDEPWIEHCDSMCPPLFRPRGWWLKDSEKTLRAPENERIHFYMPGSLKTLEITQEPLKMNAFIFDDRQLQDNENNPRAPENERVHFSCRAA